MKIERESFLRVLQSVIPGVAARETLEQSGCFVFKNGDVITFNDDIACSAKTGLDKNITTAVPAKPLIAILSKIPEDVIEILSEEGQITILSGKKETILKSEVEIKLPYDSVVGMTKKWKPLNPKFLDAVNVVHRCVSKDETKGELTCVHVAPDRLESTDSYKAARFFIETGITEPHLARGDALKHLPNLGVTEFSEAKEWVHFRNKDLVFSCRCYVQDFSNIDGHFKVKGQRVTLPKGITEAAERAAVFSAENSDDDLVTVSIKGGKLRIRGEGVKGWHSEPLSMTYDGEPISFMIPPQLLGEIVKDHNSCLIGSWEVNGNVILKMKITGEDWEYITILDKPKEGKK